MFSTICEKFIRMLGTIRWERDFHANGKWIRSNILTLKGPRSDGFCFVLAARGKSFEVNAYWTRAARVCHATAFSGSFMSPPRLRGNEVGHYVAFFVSFCVLVVSRLSLTALRWAVHWFEESITGPGTRWCCVTKLRWGWNGNRVYFFRILYQPVFCSTATYWRPTRSE